MTNVDANTGSQRGASKKKQRASSASEESQRTPSRRTFPQGEKKDANERQRISTIDRSDHADLRRRCQSDDSPAAATGEGGGKETKRNQKEGEREREREFGQSRFSRKRKERSEEGKRPVSERAFSFSFSTSSLRLTMNDHLHIRSKSQSERIGQTTIQNEDESRRSFCTHTPSNIHLERSIDGHCFSHHSFSFVKFH